MALTAEQKGDSALLTARMTDKLGSPEAQIALLTKRVADLTEHPQGAQARMSFAARTAVAGGRRRRLIKYYFPDRCGSVIVHSSSGWACVADPRRRCAPGQRPRPRPSSVGDGVRGATNVAEPLWGPRQTRRRARPGRRPLR